MVNDFLSLDTTILSLESVLKIEYAEKDSEKLVNAAIYKLERQLGFEFNRDIEMLRAEQGLIADTLNIFLGQVIECLKSMALYTQAALANRSITIDLGDVNYLGLTKERLIVALEYLMDTELYTQESSNIIPSLKAALNNINTNTIKRLFICLLVFDRLGIKEGVAVMANYLYLGGI